MVGMGGFCRHLKGGLKPHLSKVYSHGSRVASTRREMTSKAVLDLNVISNSYPKNPLGKSKYSM